MTRDTGGPAFPGAIAVGPAGDVYHGFVGMDLRDWFAGQALPGMLEDYHPVEASRLAYECADAMLLQRAKP